MTRSRVRLTVMIVLLTVIGIIACSSAIAAELRITVTPDALSGEGTVNVVIHVKNTSTAPMENIRAKIGDVEYAVGNIKIGPGEETDLSINEFKITANMLGNEIPVVISWTENGESKSQKDSFVVYDSNDTIPDEEIEFSYSVDKTAAELNSKVVFTYVIKSLSPREVSQVTLVDNGIGGASQIISGMTLAPGEEKVLTYEYTMGTKSVTAVPILTYLGSNGVKSIQGEPITIEYVTVELTVDMIHGDTGENGTEFKFTIINRGNQSVTDMSVKDNEGNTVKRGFSVGAGETVEVDYTVPPTETRVISFTVTGKLATGEKYTYTTKEVELFAYISEQDSDIRFDITVIEMLSDEGYVTFQFRAKNNGSLDMTDLVITETELGSIGTMRNLSGGDEDIATFTLYVGNARNLEFTLTVMTPIGRELKFNRVVTKSAFTVPATTISGSGTQLAIGDTVTSWLKTIMIIFSVIAAVSGIAFIVFAVLEKMRQANKI